MAIITIRRLDDSTKALLRVRAAQHRRSMEEEARQILKGALAKATARQPNLAERIRARFAPLGGVDLAEFPRGPVREPPGVKFESVAHE
jgi:plasmid stability protein